MAHRENLSSAIIVPGLACNEKSSVLIPLIKEHLESRKLDTHCINGIVESEEGTRPYAKTPDQAYAEIGHLVEQRTSPQIIISHCLGALSLVRVMQDYPQVTGAMIAPPLAYPHDVLTHRSVQIRQSIKDGLTTVQAKYFSPDHPYDFTKMTPTDVVVTGDYHDQIGQMNADFPESVRELHASGRLSLVLPDDDWNTTPKRILNDWPGKTLSLPNTKHSLNMLDDPDLVKQRSNVEKVVNFILDRAK